MIFPVFEFTVGANTITNNLRYASKSTLYCALDIHYFYTILLFPLYVTAADDACMYGSTEMLCHNGNDGADCIDAMPFHCAVLTTKTIVPSLKTMQRLCTVHVNVKRHYKLYRTATGIWLFTTLLFSFKKFKKSART